MLTPAWSHFPLLPTTLHNNSANKDNNFAENRHHLTQSAVDLWEQRCPQSQDSQEEKHLSLHASLCSSLLIKNTNSEPICHSSSSSGGTCTRWLSCHSTRAKVPPLLPRPLKTHDAVKTSHAPGALRPPSGCSPRRCGGRVSSLEAMAPIRLQIPVNVWLKQPIAVYHALQQHSSRKVSSTLVMFSLRCHRCLLLLL